MQLTSFSVSNYRSITSAHKIEVGHLTVLLGKNNEGKSNILRALDTAMTILLRHSTRTRATSQFLPTRDDAYQWKRDFPVQLQERHGRRLSTFRLEFRLTEVETAEFKAEVGVTLNGLLPLEITVGSENQLTFSIKKPGRGSKTLANRSIQVAQFVARRIRFNYIPAVRTGDDTLEMVRNMVDSELKLLESDPQYQAALTAIADIQRPILDAIAQKVGTTLGHFLPGIRSVRVDVSDSERRYSLRRTVDVVIDDGIPTKLDYKGDGVKSLAALALLRDVRSSGGGASILAIEEPEAHLHPGAMHQVNQIINSILGEHQVLITTHNPIFANRESLSSNIIVSGGGARSAKSIRAVREVLGIRASDNLSSANYALVVEGPEDLTIFSALLPALSEKLKVAMTGNLLAIVPIGGSGKLSYMLNLLHSQLCSTHVFLDDDDAGRTAYGSAEAAGLATAASVSFSTCLDQREAEIEDLVRPDLYAPAFQAEFGVDLAAKTFLGREKWSTRLSRTFRGQGKPWNEKVQARSKAIVSESVRKRPKSALLEGKSGPIDALVVALERMVG